jgi:hypothetical protein
MQRIGFPFLLLIIPWWILIVRSGFWISEIDKIPFTACPSCLSQRHILTSWTDQPSLYNSIPWTSQCSAGKRCSIKRLFI